MRIAGGLRAQGNDLNYAMPFHIALVSPFHKERAPYCHKWIYAKQHMLVLIEN